MNKDLAIRRSKEFRKDADALLQRMKQHKDELAGPWDDEPEQKGEAIAQHMLSIRELEGAIMRQGMVLKNIADNKPYPESYNPESAQVEPTADNLQL